MRLALCACLIVLSCNRNTDDKSLSPRTPATAVPPALSLDAEVAAKLVPVEAPARKLWTLRLDDDATFDAYSGRKLGGEKFAKFVID